MTPAGQRSYRVTVQRDAGTTRDEHNEPVEDWQELGEFAAKLRRMPGAEKRQAASEGAVVPLTLRVLNSARTRAVQVSDRLIFEGAAWDVVSAEPVDRREIEWLAVAAK